MNENIILKVNNLEKTFSKRGPRGRNSAHDFIKAVDDVSFSLVRGETLGLVGGSGSGKTTIARILAGILVKDRGDVFIDGDLDIVFQDPYSSLNPRMRVRDIVAESLYVRGVGASGIKEKVENTFRLVGLDLATSVNKYPHQFSGGERQRIAIAKAIIRRPDIVILDEPVSSLDVSIQALILNLLKDIQDELGLSYVFISHDLRVVEFMADTVCVLKEGRLVETASKDMIYKNPQHEYTRKLLEAIP